MASTTKNDDNVESAIQNEDIFDAILNIEESKTKEGQYQGNKVQKEKFTSEGFNLGLKKGFEVGSEIAFYKAFAQTWLQLPNLKEKEAKVLEQLLKLIEKFPTHNSKEESETDCKLAINAKFKQACAILKINSVKSPLEVKDW